MGEGVEQLVAQAPARRPATADEIAEGSRVTYIAHIDSVKLPTHQPVPRSIILIWDVHPSDWNSSCQWGV
jgi:hypothetical protein